MLNPNRQPDFRNLLAVLERRVPERPTLFEFFLNERLHDQLTGVNGAGLEGHLAVNLHKMEAFHCAGYDYYDVQLPNFDFPAGWIDHARTISQNQGAVIHDRQTLREYAWQDPDAAAWPLL